MKATITIESKENRSPESIIDLKKGPGDILILTVSNSGQYFPVCLNRLEALVLAAFIQSVFPTRLV